MRGRGCEAGHLSAFSLRAQKTRDIVSDVDVRLESRLCTPVTPATLARSFNTDFALKAVSCVPVDRIRISVFKLLKEFLREISREAFLRNYCVLKKKKKRKTLVP